MNKELQVYDNLIVTTYNRFNWVVYESRLSNKVFVSYYYESGFNQDSVVLDLTEKEIKGFRSDQNSFLKVQSSDIRKYYHSYKLTRDIKGFHQRIEANKLLPNWKKSQEVSLNNSDNSNEKLQEIEIKPNSTLINADINKSFRLKIHGTSGPGFHTEFKFTIRSAPTVLKIKQIDISVNLSVRSTYSINSALEHFNELVKYPMHRGVNRFIDYLKSNNMAISHDLNINVKEYVFHPIDSKPIGNEIGMEIALKSIFKDQIGFEIIKEYISEEK